VKDEAIVLHARAYGDADAIVSLFAKVHGRVAVYGRGVRSAKRQNAPPLLPLYEVRLELDRKQGSDLYSARAVDLVNPHAVLQTDLVRLGAANCVLELAREMFQEGQTDELVFERLRVTLTELERGVAIDVLDDFEHELLAALGYQQEEAGDDARARFHERTRIFTRLHGRELPARAFFRDVLR
jgi:DNA repair protein RecO